MAITEEQVRRWLAAVKPADQQTDIVSARRVEWVSVLENAVSLKLHMPDIASDARAMEAIAGACLEAIRQGAVRAGERVRAVRVRFVDHDGEVVRESAFEASPKGALRPAGERSPEHKSEPQPQAEKGPSIPGVTHAIAVGAGKGGVGKSTVAVNLAVGLARRGYAAGLLDGDIYGPSLPTLMGLGGMEPNVLEGRFQPFMTHGVKSMTVGKLVEADKPLIWRGPMAHGAFKQLTEKTDWGELDHLVIDLPPGTGDVPLTMAQNLELSGAVIVCTPQRVAQDDAVRAVKMFEQLGVDILGVVENMCVFIAPDGQEFDIFGRGGAQQMAQRLGLPFLGALPITMDLRANSDAGDPTANFEAGGAAQQRWQKAFDGLLTNLENQLALASVRHAKNSPSLTIQ
ncbi:MAG: Mrp/NBP35 family ATP-binding protein [Phycisphaerales bacterium JB060]